MKRNRLFVCAVLTVLVGAADSTRGEAQSPEPVHDHTATGGTLLMVSRDLEMRLAVDALPKPLRGGASVLVLEPTGYVKARAGTNAFTCMVSRRGGNFYPVCFDEEGTHTILRAYADDAVLRLKGATEQEIERRLADGFAQGTYRAPTRPGVAYMLSPAQYMLEGGRLTRTPPHTMFYAPFLTNGDVGGVGPSLFSAQNSTARYASAAGATKRGGHDDIRATAPTLATSPRGTRAAGDSTRRVWATTMGVVDVSVTDCRQSCQPSLDESSSGTDLAPTASSPD